MKKIFFSIILIFSLATTMAQVKITQMPTSDGNGSGGFLPIVENGINKKILADSLLRKTLIGYMMKLDSLNGVQRINVDSLKLDSLLATIGGGGTDRYIGGYADNTSALVTGSPIGSYYNLPLSSGISRLAFLVDNPAYSTININVTTSGTYSFFLQNPSDIVIKWPNGTFSRYNTGGTIVVSKYFNAGSYVVKIFGSFGAGGNIEFSDINGSNFNQIVTATNGFTAISTLYQGSFAFQNCTHLTTIPAGLISSDMTYALFMFSGCTNVTSVDQFLLTSAYSLAFLGSMFNGCTSLTTIPDGFFDSVSNGTDFSAIFQNCTSLTAIPAGLFDFTTSADDFTNAFRGCTSLTGNAPPLWTMYPLAAHSGCFQGCTGLANYASIPSDWK